MRAYMSSYIPLSSAVRARRRFAQALASSWAMRAMLVAAATVLLVASSACAASNAGGAKPTLSVSRGKLHGAHFASGELVRVTIVAAGDSSTRRMRTSGTGTFTATLPVAKCLGTVVVIVRGATGDGARMKLAQRTCAPSLKPPSG